MDALLDQLGLDKTFFIEIALFSVLFFILSPLYFKPFLKLFQARHKKTVEDKEAAERLLHEAGLKLEEYKRILLAERTAAKKEYETVLLDARKQEAQILAEAREEAKKITQDAAESANRQRENLRRQLEVDAEGLAQNISDRLLSRKV